MEGFSAWHLIGLLFLVVLVIWPLWLIIRRTGNPGPAALLILVPVVGTLVLWWLALARWPALDQANARSGS